MKKVVIVTRRMILGGIEKALISMLEQMPKDKYDVTVLVMGVGGELEDEIPLHVKLKCLYGDEKSTLEKIWKKVKVGNVIDALKIGWYTFLSRKVKSVFDQEMYHLKMVPNQEVEFDLAIAYHVPASLPVVYVINNIKAKSKVAWIHSDVSHYETALSRYKDYYAKYDKIFCVSQFALNKFNEIFPNLREKTSVFYNILDKQKFESLSLKGKSFEDNFDGIKILTIGRLTGEKGQDIIPVVLKKLISEGFNIRWYCIGEGDCRLRLENMIEANNLGDHMLLLGNKKNPYPFIKDCDIYVQPSRHEGYCISLAEARSLNKPIVTTDFVGAREQINNCQTGIIVKFDENEIYNSVKKLIKDKAIINKFINNLKNEKINTVEEMKKLFDCVG
ncbi:glycosyltransferase [Cytobacillus firmus]|uniref:glycosyltransferase n=1 Tax=Cytobacillus firmus TaxID=1399 RepID=UPI001CFDA98D|nr:glycosyltransferase [Cytobacillus firmus]